VETSVKGTVSGGRRTDGTPGLMNELMAKVVRTLPTHLSIFAQGDLADLLPNDQLLAVTPTQNGLDDTRKKWLESIGVKKKAPFYIASRDMALWHKKMCDEHGFKHPILVAYNPHMPRAYWVSRKVGLDVIIPKIPPPVYDPLCSQPWMRSPLKNYPREFGARCLDFVLGNI
jgi:hypothetical protein